MNEAVEENTTYHYRVAAVDGGGNEGLLAYGRHGRTGADTTSLQFSDNDVWASGVPPSEILVFDEIGHSIDYTIETKDIIKELLSYIVILKLKEIENKIEIMNFIKYIIHNLNIKNEYLLNYTINCLLKIKIIKP